MPGRTKIQWTDFSSNPVKARRKDNGKPGEACVKISPGCAHCYAETLNKRWGTGANYTVTGLAQVEHYLDEKELRRLLKFALRMTGFRAVDMVVVKRPEKKKRGREA